MKQLQFRLIKKKTLKTQYLNVTQLFSLWHHYAPMCFELFIKRTAKDGCFFFH
jgi:hypothetical protein